MKLAVLGANGRTGRQLVRVALTSGHEVRGGARRIRPALQSAKLEFISCDATSVDDVRRLIRGCDAVISVIGHVRGSAANMQTNAMIAITTAMQLEKISRIISLTGTGVRFPGDHHNVIDDILNKTITIIDPKRVRDGQQHVEVLMNSRLDWSVLRVSKLTPGGISKFQLTASGPTKPFVSRATVALALLQIVERHSFSQAAPMISSSAARAFSN